MIFRHNFWGNRVSGCQTGSDPLKNWDRLTEIVSIQSTKSGLDGFSGYLRQIRKSKKIYSTFESVRVGTREEVEIRISSNRDSFENNHCTSEQSKVIGNMEREDEKYFVELVTEIKKL
jgi:hypothetical protein